MRRMMNEYRVLSMQYMNYQLYNGLSVYNGLPVYYCPSFAPIPAEWLMHLPNDT